MKTRALLIVLALSLVINAGGFVIAYLVLDGAERDIAGSFNRSVAALVAAHPDAAGVLARIVVEGARASDIELGLAELRRYGVDEAQIAELYEPLSHLSGHAGVLSIAGWVMSVVALCAVFLVMRGMEKGMNRIRDIAEDIVAGGQNEIRGGEYEGPLGRLHSQVAQSAHRLRGLALKAQEDRDREKDFLADVSHQLKTPLAGLRLAQELLLDMDDEELIAGRAFLKRSLSHVDHIEWLVQTLLSIARLEGKVLVLDKRPSPIDETIAGVVTKLSPWAEEGGVSLLWSPTEDGHAVAHDGPWMGEALSNILINAIRETPRGGAVKVESRDTPLFTSIVVEDGGQGIRDEELPHIFDRFYRGSERKDRRDRMHGGVGLGLALAKAIVEGHDGSITVDKLRRNPEGEGGTRFVITIPKLTRS